MALGEAHLVDHQRIRHPGAGTLQDGFDLCSQAPGLLERGALRLGGVVDEQHHVDLRILLQGG
ncbi:hypothetical protein [Nesterenkonia sp. CF4.4]|uniref:hypothetical protein n=1 Tax=Nesterenkonia sp. CF4.4 TaxID=3373079 RepID=UPI003EE525DC